MNKYSLIELYTDEKSNLLYAIITYQDGSTERVDNLDVIKEKIAEFAKQEGITYEAIISDSSKIKECKVHEIVEEKNSDKEEEEIPLKNDNRIRNKIIKVTSLGAALVLAFFAGKGLTTDRKKSSEYQSMTINKEDTVDNSLSTTSNTPSPVIYDNNLLNLANRINNGNKLSSDEMDYVLNEINRQSYLNVSGVEKLVNGRNMTGLQEEISLYELFPNDSFDYLMTLHFCSQRNNIVNNARNQNSAYTKNELNGYLNEIIDFTFNGKQIEYGGHNYNFYNLNPLARYIIVDLGMNWLTANRSYVGNINGQRCNYSSLVGEYAETYSTITENLVNRASMHK